MLALPCLPVGRNSANGRIDNIPSGTPSITVIGTSVTSGAGANTITVTPVELFAGTAVVYDVGEIELWFAPAVVPAAIDAATMLFIYTGAGGSEVEYVANLSIGTATSATITPGVIRFPCFIPHGTRLSMRTRSIVASKAFWVTAFLYPAEAGRAGLGRRGPTKFEVLGSTAPGSRGTAHLPGSTGSYSTAVDFGTTTAFDARYIMLLCDGQGIKSDVTMTNISYVVELSKSGGPIYGIWWIGNTTGENQIRIPSGMSPCDIPKGTQLQIRGTGSGTAESQSYTILLAG